MKIGNVEVTDDEIITLFEWAHRFCETDKLAFSHPAEAVVIDKIAGELERSRTEPFRDDYGELLKAARKRILEAYEKHMGKDTWIHKLPMDQD
jgi:hypothetical protein